MSYDHAQLFRALLPETTLVIGAMLVLVLDIALFRRRPDAVRFNIASAVGALSCAVGVWLACNVGAIGAVYGNVLVIDPLAVGTRIGVLVLTLLTLGVGTGARVPRHPVEYVAVILFAATGLSLIAAAQQLLLVFVALELASLSLYVLVGFDKTRPESAEAALKYFLFGGMSAAFLLFGFSLLFGLSGGALDLTTISVSLFQRGWNPLLAVAVVMIVVAFGFKTAAAPFHLWAPDAYQGAPAPSAALIASASKLAGLVLFLRLFWSAGAVPGNQGQILAGGLWMPVVALLSGASLLLGNLVALAQSNVRRLLAYSAIAHAGALLLGVLAAQRPFGSAPVFYYAATYGLATVGAFGVIGLVDRAGGCEKLSDLAGLRQRSPFLTACLFVFILSLAGIPPLAGFFGKFYVFAAALKLAGLDSVAGWLAVAAILLSAVGLYYYLLVLKQALVVPAKANPSPVPLRVPFIPAATLAAAALALILCGAWPALLLDLAALR
jgi:NADH-quinone oxidoreductase subunit N